MNERPGDFREPRAEPLPGFLGAAEEPAAETVEPRIGAMIDAYLARNPAAGERLIPLLHLVQTTLGHVPVAAQQRIAERLELPLVQVHGVVSFYRFFSTTPRAKYQLEVCMGTACFVRRARALSESIRQVLGTDPGSVTKDGLFGLKEVRCLGSCGLAPVVKLNDEIHGGLTPGETRKLVFGLQARARRERLLGPDGGDDA